jgi:DNA-binding MarR family transcriptional regulator
MSNRPYLVVPLLKAFYWFDEGLQAYLRHKGWRGISRPQAMVMANVAMGVTRPTDIARNLGVSRQAIHVTIGQMIKKGMIELREDPRDKRGKTVVISATGRAMRRHAQAAMEILTAGLRKRIGARHFSALQSVLAADWGRPVTDFSLDLKGRRKKRG